ncbi:MAG: hypothetical protein KAI45_11830, partial [Melioribacteraceae bacterium]|nr:hypothetical protein [Melioribacteraceae bacterium]
KMKKIKLINQPAIIIGLTIIFLIGTSYMPEGLSIFGIEIKQVDILEDLQSDETEEDLDKEINMQDSLQSFDNKNRNINFASISYGLELNFTKKISDFIENKYVKLEKSRTYNVPTFKNSPLEGNLEQLQYFFEALNNSKSSQVRIAHYGDSSLEGDLITAYLRNKFQQKFGGKGVGFLPITSVDINFRETTKIRFSDDWITASIIGNNPDNIPVGVSGKVFLNSKGSWVTFEAIPKFRTVRNFDV